jgi:hypothetical protein
MTNPDQAVRELSEAEKDLLLKCHRNKNVGEPIHTGFPDYYVAKALAELDLGEIWRRHTHGHSEYAFYLNDTGIERARQLAEKADNKEGLKIGQWKQTELYSVKDLEMWHRHFGKPGETIIHVVLDDDLRALVQKGHELAGFFTRRLSGTDSNGLAMPADSIAEASGVLLRLCDRVMGGRAKE